MFDKKQKSIFVREKREGISKSNSEYVDLILNPKKKSVKEDLELIVTERSYEEISTFMTKLTNDNERLDNEIVRWESYVNTNPILEREVILRYIWLHKNKKSLLMKPLAILAKKRGNCNMLIKMLEYDLVYNGWDNKMLSWRLIAIDVLKSIRSVSGLECLIQSLPKERAKSKCCNVRQEARSYIFKWFTSVLFGKKKFSEEPSYLKYRKLITTKDVKASWKELMRQPHIQEFYSKLKQKQFQ